MPRVARLDIRGATRSVRYNCRVMTRQFRYIALAGNSGCARFARARTGEGCRPPERSFVLASPTGLASEKQSCGLFFGKRSCPKQGVQGGRLNARPVRLCDGERVGGPRSGGRGTPSVCSIYGARRAPFDIIAALQRGNFDILPLRAIRDAPAARERGKGKRLSLFSSRSDISNDPVTGSYIESAEEGSPLRRLFRIARKPAQYLERAPRA